MSLKKDHPTNLPQKSCTYIDLSLDNKDKANIINKLILNVFPLRRDKFSSSLEKFKKKYNIIDEYFHNGETKVPLK